LCADPVESTFKDQRTSSKERLHVLTIVGVMHDLKICYRKAHPSCNFWQKQESDEGITNLVNGKRNGGVIVKKGLPLAIVSLFALTAVSVAFQHSP
jgi:hypothetical protein